ncbi:ATP-binding cassette domain-containing protein [Microbacteriaceae bacterium K1510]|nr:ATP-binding cassette domain-containing protein [Microbacteriaceae bacterium K1510]
MNAGDNSQAPLLTLRDVSKTYRLRSSILSRMLGRSPSLNALADISLDVFKGEIVGIVGESGSGKSTLGRIILRLLQPTTGALTYRGMSVPPMGSRALRDYRRSVQMIFQDTGSALNPRKRIRRLLHEALQAAGVPHAERNGQARELLARTGLPEFVLDRYPHMLSGGQRQRVNIARALAMQPELLVADEPVSALDVSLQGQIINLLTTLAREAGLTLILISHDLAVVRRVCTRVVVMQSGRIVETGAPAELMANPRHPYTRKLIDAVPKGLAGRAGQPGAASHAAASAAVTP